MTLTIRNADARRLLIDLQGLSMQPRNRLSPDQLYALIEKLGFVQLDSIQTVERAHHHILHSRSQCYRPADLKRLHEREGRLFENWTHDASVIPAPFYGYWKHRFARDGARLMERFTRWQRDEFAHVLEDVRAHIEANGPTMARDLGNESGPKKRNEGWWEWHPTKTALEYLWRTGDLAVVRRQGFQKVYDLSERAIPAEHFGAQVSHEAFVDWACASAIDRLGFATPSEIAGFWDLIELDEARKWCARALERRDLIEVGVENADGSARGALARPDIEAAIAAPPEPPSRLRVLSPFDPLIRDRARTERLFGYRYRIEIFVPEPKREYGYYVFPLMEGDRLVGRIDMKHHRKEGELRVAGLWWEPGMRKSAGRADKLEAELDRIRAFTGAEQVTFADTVGT
ncbi:DNA glycosylase AlkZ-like family protein [Breoghania sp.]|uniref:winged helix-turn-helix domain-containing protein n=1 Tax=Breoghania sp. TaxID=2065378 RepID=UPI002AA806C0|nr:crosslink repair DNA glycosylase YcaQ family protein [Breoghania sp.]